MGTTTKQIKPPTQNKFACRLANIYARQPVSKTKSRKRSASTSPVRQRKFKDSCRFRDMFKIKFLKMYICLHVYLFACMLVF